MTSGIYKIKNKKTGQIYIGQSKNIERRFKQHCKISAIDLAIEKEGINNFDFNIIEEVDDDNLLNREQYWIQYYNAYQNPEHYNEYITPVTNLSQAVYTLWNISYVHYIVSNVLSDDKPYKGFSFRYKGYRPPIGHSFYDFLSCEIIGNLIDSFISD